MARRPASARDLIIPVAAMTIVVAASNVLVRHPVEAFGLDDKLTWGAFAYPFAFLINDLTNRRFGPAAARRVVLFGFATAVLLSVGLASPRVAAASGAAFLLGQLLDVTAFSALRRQAWWRAPLAASLIGSALDTAIFFSLAFAYDPAMSARVPLLASSAAVPLWVNLAAFDFIVKTAAAVVLLAPYRALTGALLADDGAAASGAAP